MTIIKRINRKCAVCGKTSLQAFLTSTNSFGYPDLDLRSPEMQRSTMNTWLDECPHCGYVASKLENELEVPADLLKTDEYLTCEGHDFKSDLSRRFYRHHLISKAQKDYSSEFLSLHHCAWTCDDNDDNLAFEMRKMALQSMDQMVVESEDEKNSLNIIKADLLRRTGQFERLIEEFKDLILKEKIQNDVITFQIELAMKKDDDCHTVEDVIKKSI